MFGNFLEKCTVNLMRTCGKLAKNNSSVSNIRRASHMCKKEFSKQGLMFKTLFSRDALWCLQWAQHAHTYVTLLVVKND